MTVEARVLEGVRWSSAVRCPRQAVYDAQSAPRREWSDTELRVFRRGSAWGRILADDVCAEYRDQGRRPRREEEVPWPAESPIGVGHADIYIPHEGLIVECFSTSGGGLLEEKALQAAGYAVNHPRAAKAGVLSVDTHSGEDSYYPIDVEALTPRVHQIEESVVEGLNGGALPERVCRTPGEGARCPFRDHCFSDWQETPLDELLDGAALLEALADLEDDVAARRVSLRRAEQARDAARQEVDQLITPDAETSGSFEAQAGGVTVKETRTLARSFSLSSAEKAGHQLPASLEPFVSTSLRTRWTVKRWETGQ